MAATPKGKKPEPHKSPPAKPAATKKAAGVAASARDDVQPAKPRADWEAIERDYRTGRFTLRELEAKHGAFNSSIARKAKRDGWTQDLSIAIKQATHAKLTEALVSSAASDGAQKDSSAVLVAAEVNKQVILGHRKGLQELASVKRTLLDQIQQAAALLPDLAEVIEMVRNPDDNGIDRANDALRKAMSRSALVDDLKKLADVDEKVRKGEREAFDLDLDPAKQAPTDDTKKLSDVELALRVANLMAKAGAA
jgi:hypothetical protein